MPYSTLGAETGVGSSEAHRALARAARVGLYLPDRRQVSPPHLIEFLLHGLQYLFPAQRTAPTRGVPTGWAAPVLDGEIVFADGDVPVWPHPEGTVRGVGLLPLHPNVPTVAPSQPDFYALLALTDAVREGRSRERRLAADELDRRIRHALASAPDSPALP